MNEQQNFCDAIPITISQYQTELHKLNHYSPPWNGFNTTTPVNNSRLSSVSGHKQNLIENVPELFVYLQLSKARAMAE